MWQIPCTLLRYPNILALAKKRQNPPLAHPLGFNFPTSKPTIQLSSQMSSIPWTTTPKAEKIFSRGIEPGPTVRAQIEQARKTAKTSGESTFRYTSNNRIIEVFFEIDLEHLANARRSNLPTMDEALTEADTYDEIPVDVFYVAYDTNMVLLVCHFPSSEKKIPWGRRCCVGRTRLRPERTERS
jgi:hypothetical protein